MKLIPFNFETHPVRVAEMDGDPWFVAKDVATALGYANPQEAVRDHCKHARQIGGERNAHPLDPQTKIIPEGDVYRLITRSKLPSADKFERLVMDDILPTIRRTGGYGQQPIDEEKIAAIAGAVFRAMIPEIVKANLANGARNVRGWVLAVQVAENYGVPMKGRGKLVQRISAGLKKFCDDRGWPAPQFEYREDGKRSRRMFAVEAVAAWARQEGLAMVAAHLAKQPFARRPPEDQGILPFVAPKKR